MPDLDVTPKSGVAAQSRLIIACLFILILASVLSFLAKNGLYLFGSSPVPLRANPISLTLSLLASVACCLLAVRLLVFRSASFVPVVMLGSLFVLSIGLMIGGISPAPGSIVGRDIEASPPALPGRTAFALNVYFPNGSPNISESEHDRLIDALQVFRRCELGALIVRGFASSAPFQGVSQQDSDMKNVALANSRAGGVAKLIEKSTGQTPKSEIWNTYFDMTNDRQINDAVVNGRRDLESERLNRRVEIIWNDSQCFAS